MRFTKMHGLGNCYIFVDCFEQKVTHAPALAKAVSDRNTGVGSDGLILICPSDKAAARMEMYNLDGSRGQMCGNGIRCLAKYVYDHGLARDNPMTIETDAGVLTLELAIAEEKVTEVRVDMGPPRLEPEDMPARLSKDEMVDRPVQILGQTALMTCVSMGNPHVVIYGVPLANIGPGELACQGERIEKSETFPQRTNVHFVEVVRKDEVRVLTWERGSGPTQACGTGAAAVCVAGVLTNRSNRKITTHLPGGDLRLEWSDQNNHVFMTGPAVEIFSGTWPER